MSNCDSYGEFDYDLQVILMNPNDLEKGVDFRLLSSNGHQIHNRIQCSDLLPEGHFSVVQIADEDTTTIHLNSVSRNFCIGEIEDPFTYDGDCTFTINRNENTYVLDISTLNSPSTSGWEIPISLVGNFGNYSLKYQPCGTITCPTNTNCEGDSNAYVYLCYNNSQGQQCTGYGLDQYPLAAYLYQSGVGITIEYRGNDDKIALINLICNQSIQPGQIEFSKTAVLNGNAFIVSGQSKDTCFSNMPTPTPCTLR